MNAQKIIQAVRAEGHSKKKLPARWALQNAGFSAEDALIDAGLIKPLQADFGAGIS